MIRPAPCQPMMRSGIIRSVLMTFTINALAVLAGDSEKTRLVTYDASGCGHPFDSNYQYDIQSQIYNLNENECIWGEPYRNKMVISPGGKGKSWCVHRYTGVNCTCYAESFTVESSSGYSKQCDTARCYALNGPDDKDLWQSYRYTTEACPEEGDCMAQAPSP